MMNVSGKVVLLALTSFAFFQAEAQIDCSLPTSTKLVCLVPFNTGAALSYQGLDPTYQKAAVASTSIFNAPLGAQLSQLPSAAAAPGAVIFMNHGNPEAYDNLGPVLIDRPDSVGQGRFALGFSMQQFRFNHLDGVALNSIPLVFAQQTSGGTLYTTETVATSIKYNQYVAVATYGFPRKTDLSLIFPFTRISIGAFSENPQTLTPGATVLSDKLSTQSAHGSASGLGDIVVNAKHVLWSGGEAGKGSLATGVALRFPTGDALNYLGSGAFGVNLYGLAAYKSRFSPHVKISYQWNADSVLLNVSGSGPKQRLPGGLQAAIGADIAASRHLTASVDFLGTEYQNSPSIFQTTYGNTAASVVNGVTAPSAVSNLQTVSNSASSDSTTPFTRTFVTGNMSVGVKWKPFLRQDIILYGNILLPLNDVGLRSDPAPSGGISYNFAGPKKWPDWMYRSPYNW